MAKSGVYFILSGKRTKIGYSGDIDARIATLQTGTPERLKLFCWIEGASQYVEGDLHRRFGHGRDIGEWFGLTPELSWYLVNLILPEPDDDGPTKVSMFQHEIALRAIPIMLAVEGDWPKQWGWDAGQG